MFFKRGSYGNRNKAEKHIFKYYGNELQANGLKVMAKEKEIATKEPIGANLFEYNEASIKSLDWKEHIRLRPGMYIGKLGDGSSPDDGIYVLVKEVMDNCIDEYAMGFGKTIELTVSGKEVTVRDYGRGIPLGKVVDAVSRVNTGAKFDSKVFQKSVGLNGVGTKAVNALCNYFKVTAIREGKEKTAEFTAASVALALNWWVVPLTTVAL